MSGFGAWPGVPDEEAGLLTRIVRLNLLVTRVLEQLVEPHGLSVPDYLVLATIRRSAYGRTSPATIAEVLGRTTGGMTLTLDRLAAAGWVRRLPEPSDRRRVGIELTDEGRELAERVNNALHDWEARLPVEPGARDDVLGSVEQMIALVERSELIREAWNR
ncbi:MarR family winged helix-turn-helix transcriptional regulator [Uniformispora flossi]|uniref:MarR family winged helix-turn-helix transcriptional regulator n=1 Tax=Uniformispora flossi TaxID=3390723 RepID=UPI003C2E0A47